MAYWWLNIIIALAVGIITTVIAYSMLHTRRLIMGISIVTAVVLALFVSQFFITPYFKISSFAQQLKQQPIFSLIAAQDSTVFNAFMTAAKPLILKQKNPAALKVAAEKMEYRAFVKSLPKATNEAIVQYLTATVNLYNQLLNQNPQLVLAYEFPQQFPRIDLNTIDSTAFQKELDAVNKAKAAVIISAIRYPQPKVELYEIKYLFDIVWSRLNTKYGEAGVKQVFSNANTSKLDPKMGASIVTDYYQQVLRLGMSNAGKIIRYTNTT